MVSRPVTLYWTANGEDREKEFPSAKNAVDYVITNKIGEARVLETESGALVWEHK
jgi:hypothetical protein